ncbi:uncharacterized protein DSM5745_11105 [Aspergillus mulundensis]|uniref:RNase MRP protein 1 RNA binding domain-containing protein n=1 Tax=Aspergillus mulundensis TaxID=1810919 RepID=A0A3D8QC46_9EURO|nr:hypothetical protein DSM5745_11105 [Aspergillus mulundensis]RDW59277.1 hypothetical protein DSM5745_11105 [Aspergillus mulundensis]
MLHLISHHNRNQHGKAKWWKWLSILKRAVRNLALSLSPEDQEISRSSGETYKRYLADRILPRCYLAFSVVVADVQFSTLGTVLLATLAQLSKSTGADKELKLQFPVENNRESVPTFYRNLPKMIEDIGEALPRTLGDLEAVQGFEMKQTLQRPILGEIPPTKTSEFGDSKILVTAKSRKKKKQKKNAIDDLFDGLCDT